jgi:hypothetical protein
VSHRAHDYAHLVRRWRAVAKLAGVKLTPFAQAGDFKLFYLQTSGAGLYLSAGIHGDEPGASEGLIAWAEKHARELARLPLLIFPCLNPWGLTQNCRLDENGLDLNRAFDRDSVPVTRALRDVLRDRQFAAALTLHEDYDAQGIYLYEVQRERPFWGEALIRAARHVIPIDPRSRVDTSPSLRGVIRRKFDAQIQRRIGGMPEAIYLHRHHARRSITFETPSEFALDKRVAAQVALIEACVSLSR